MGLRVIGPPADGVKRGGYPGGAGDTTDTYTDKLVKLVPAEAVTVYPILASQAKIAGGTNHLLLYLTAWVLLLVVIVLRWNATSVPGKGPQYGAIFIAAVAFFIWVNVMGGDFGLEMLFNKPPSGTAGGSAASQIVTRATAPVDAAPDQMKGFVSNLALTTWTLVAPAVYKGDQES